MSHFLNHGHNDKTKINTLSNHGRMHTLINELPFSNISVVLREKPSRNQCYLQTVDWNEPNLTDYFPCITILLGFSQLFSQARKGRNNAKSFRYTSWILRGTHCIDYEPVGNQSIAICMRSDQILLVLVS